MSRDLPRLPWLPMWGVLHALDRRAVVAAAKAHEIAARNRPSREPILGGRAKVS